MSLLNNNGPVGRQDALEMQPSAVMFNFHWFLCSVFWSFSCDFIMLFLRVINWLEKLFIKIFFFMILIWFCYDFVMISIWLILCFFLLGLKNLMILIWFSYGLGMLQFFVMKIVMAASIVFIKNIIFRFYWKINYRLYIYNYSKNIFPICFIFFHVLITFLMEYWQDMELEPRHVFKKAYSIQIRKVVK